MPQREDLFHRYDLRTVLENEERRMNERVKALQASDLANGIEPLIEPLTVEFRVNPLEFLEGAATIEAEEVQVDARRYPDRVVIDPNRPVPIPGMRVTCTVPFSGDPPLLFSHPSTFTTAWPHGVVDGSELRFVYEVPISDVPATRKRFDEDLRLTKQWAGWVNQDVGAFNEVLPKKIGAALAQRPLGERGVHSAGSV